MEAVRLVIASPSDLRPERDLLAETIIPDLNKTVARAKGLVLEDYRWETDTTPGFHPQGWQGNIDQQLRITDAHFLIVMFWKRFGSPIQGGSEAGTEHELRIAFEAWLQSRTFPRILVYFKEEPFYAASVEEAEQFARVRRFRDQFREGGPYELGSYATFSDKLDFERKIRLHLTRSLSGLLWPATSPANQLKRIASYHLARHPKERNKAFGWGLKYTVGGTIRHLDGREVPFDELVPGLSYLDEMEPEIDFD